MTPESSFSSFTTFTITHLLIRFLDPSNSFNPRGEDVKLKILAIVNSLVPKLDKADAEKNVNSLSKLLGPVKGRAGINVVGVRSAIVDAVVSTGAVLGGKFEKASRAARDLNAMSSGHVEQYDFGKLLPVLNALGSEDCWKQLMSGESSPNAVLPIVYTCQHFVYDTDGVLSRGSLKALKALISFCSKNRRFIRFIETSVMPVIKNGVCSNLDSPRKIFVMLVRHCAIIFGGESSPQKNDSPLLFGDLAVLANEKEEEVDFFRNINHVQQHRRVRAFARLRGLLERQDSKAVFCQQSLTNFLLPMANHPIFEAKKNSDEAFALEGIATLGAISSCLKWGHWLSVANLFIVQIPKNTDNERYLVSALCKVIDGFHENVRKDLSGDDDPEVQGIKKGLEKLIPRIKVFLNKETKDKGGSKVVTLRSSVVLALLKLFQKLPDFDLKFSGLLMTVCRALKGKESDGRDIARSTLAKMSIAVGTTYFPEIVQQLANTLTDGYQLHVRSTTLHTMLLAVTRNDEILAKIHENSVFEECVPDMIDLIVQDIFGVAAEMKETVDVEKRVIKEAMGMKSYDSLEMLSTLIRFRPSDATPAVDTIVDPFINMLKLDENHANSAVIKKCRACLDKVVIGLSKNCDIKGEEVLKYVWNVISSILGGNKKRRREEEDEDNDDDIADSDSDSASERPAIEVTGKKKKKKKKNNNKNDTKDAEDKDVKAKKKSHGARAVESWTPSLQEVHNKKSALSMKRQQEKAKHIVRDGANAPKMTGSGRHGASIMAAKRGLNDPAVSCCVIFGLKLLYASLKKSKLDWRDDEVRSLAEPFVELLAKCVKRSTSDEVVLLSIKNLGFLLRWNLKSASSCKRILGSASLKILTKGGIGSSKDEVVQSIFKVLSLLFKGGDDDSTMILSEKQWRGLVSLLHMFVTNIQHQNATFTLINDIVRKKVVNVEIYELMDTVLDVTVRSNKDTVRTAASSAFSNFLTTYTLGEKKIDDYLNQIIKNVEYEHEDGRCSALNLLGHLAKKLPEKLIAEKTDKVFLPVVLRLGNDDSSKCKERCSLVLKNVLERASIKKLNELFKTMKAWVGSEATRNLGAQLFGILAEVRRDDFVAKNKRAEEIKVLLLENISSELEVLDVGGGNKNNGSNNNKKKRNVWGGNWQLVHHSLGALAKNPHKEKEVPNEVLQAMNHYRPEVKVAAGVALLAGVKEGKVSSGKFYDVVREFAGHLDCKSEEVSEEITMNAIKGLMACVTALDAAQGKDERSKTLNWLFNRLAGACRKSAGGARMNIFKCFAALLKVTDCQPWAELILEALHRAISEAEAVSNETEDNVNFMKEIVTLVEDHIGTEDFMTSYSRVQQKAAEKRDQRKATIAAEKVKDPVAAAQRKESRKEKEIERKKRRLNEKKRGSWSGKKPRR